MDKNQIIGFTLLFAVLLGWTVYNAPSEEELAASKKRQDSIENAIQIENEQIEVTETLEVANALAVDSTQTGREEKITISNDKVDITFSTKGGRIIDVLLKDHMKSREGKDREDVLTPLHLMNDSKNVFEYLIGDPEGGNITSTKNTIFTPQVSGNTVTFTAPIGGGTFTQKYTLTEGYNVDYTIETAGIKNINEESPLRLHWLEHLDKLEKNEEFEQRYSTVYYKQGEENSADYCSCTTDDDEDLSESIEWISYTNQFFNASLMSTDKPFLGADLKTFMTDLKKSKDLKKLESYVSMPITSASSKADMKFYIGPNEFEDLQSYNNNLEEIVPYGNSIFGTINRWIIRPFFEFLSGFISSKGLVILALIFIIKMLLYPLMYKMLHSQALMGALKPELAGLKEKHKNDPQKVQMETMKVYREYGVSPFGGCMPMVIQMPIWYALFRFFPASITFRQESFLWANDLSSYDSFFHLPFEIPFLGSHLSLFTILWAISTLIYTYYNSRHTDMSANPAMKYVQYFMPLMFLGFFNTYAAGLTCYMFFSNLINILQTILTKKFVFSDDKLRAELMAKKAKPKKKNSFQTRLEEAMKQQQAIQEKRNKK